VEHRPLLTRLASVNKNSTTATVHHPLRGATLIAVSVLLFACMDTTTKYLAASYQVPFIMAIRYLINLALMVVVLTPRQGRQLVATNRTGLVLVRSACLTVASLTMGLALQRMPVAETTAILFFAPILVVLAARPLLGERIGPVGWAAAIAGFCGVLLIVRPGGGLETLGIIFALATAGMNVAYQLLSRLLAASERTIALLFYSVLVGAILFGISLPWVWSGRAPSGLELAAFVSLGVLGVVGHFLYTAAYRHASASALAPMNYLQLVWAGLLGWFAFGHVPDPLSALGMAIIAASGVAIALASRRRAAPAEPLVED
jgi:drug/metabolite transporter (DMT)-like permease